MSSGLEFVAEQDEADGIVSPEIAATWSRLSIRVDGEAVTLVSAGRHTYREGLYLSTYPLAEWFVLNWWSIFYEPQRMDRAGGSSWRRATPGSWHQRHNVAAAGGGMLWPDLSLAPEGDLVRAAWNPRDFGTIGRGIRFVSRGDVLLDGVAVRRAIEDFVISTIDRLLDAGISGTTLQQEWSVLQTLPNEEREFAVSAGRLGVDPFTSDDALARSLETLVNSFPEELAEEILENVVSTAPGLELAHAWVDRALARTAHEQGGSMSIANLLPKADIRIDARQPWNAGFAAAASARSALGVSAVDQGRLDLGAVVSWHIEKNRSGGIEALAASADDRLHVVEAVQRLPSSNTWRRFTAARSLGLHALGRGRTAFVVSQASVPLHQAARSFAAELLAPRVVVADLVHEFGAPDAQAFDAVAQLLEVNSTVVERQYTNARRLVSS